VITGIVFLGLQQASELAEQLNEQNNKSDTDSTYARTCYSDAWDCD